MKILVFLFSLSVSLFNIAWATPDTAHVACVDDVYITESSGTNNDGSTIMYYGERDGLERVVFFSFTASAIQAAVPAGKDITRCILGVKFDFANDAGGSITPIVRRVIRSPFVFNEATWSIASAGNGWTTSGAKHETNDVSDQYYSVDTIGYGSSLTTATYGVNVDATNLVATDSLFFIVHDALADSLLNGDLSSVVIAVHATTTGNDHVRFREVERGIPSEYGTLHLIYDDPEGTPTPVKNYKILYPLIMDLFGERQLDD